MRPTTSERGEIWGLVLAAGEGSRLVGLARHADGSAAPKQFCALVGERTLLATTLERAARLVARRRIVVVVAEEHRRFWQEELAGWPRENVVVQPANRGTAAGLLLPLLHIAGRDPDARVAIFPSDHHVADESIFLASVAEALSALERPLDRIVLLGIEPDRPDTGLGWIAPWRDAIGAPRPVARFVEKPAADEARELAAAGALWNSFVLAARLDALLALYVRRQPELLDRMTDVVLARRPERNRARALAALYAALPARDFSRHVLAGNEDALAVLAVPPCGWSDLGTPERLAECLLARAGGPRTPPPQRRRPTALRPALEPAFA
jgi:mannose-1-phosphate guanylyltransferase